MERAAQDDLESSSLEVSKEGLDVALHTLGWQQGGIWMQVCLNGPRGLFNDQ